VSKRLLPLLPTGLLVRQVLPSPDHITIITQPRPPAAACPTCGQSSRRVHSRYNRHLRDLPWQGRPATVTVQARRFHCRTATCPRHTFAEPLVGIAARSARRTTRLAGIQRDIGAATGGEAGARLAARLGMPLSPDTVLRLLTAQPAPTRPTPKVLGVDEWAFRRRHRYGTVLVDLERHTIVDLLPDRHPSTFAAWLRAHPGVAIIARDRAGADAEGARAGAPAAVQVADRWHLLRNLGEALRAVVDQHHAAARRISREVVNELAGRPPILAEARPASPPTALERRRAAAFARRQALHDEAVAMRDGGMPIAEVAALLGKDPRTIRAWLRAGHAPRRDRRPGGSILEPYRDHLEQRWAAGCHNAAQLWRELVARGFKGHRNVVRVWARRRRKADPGGAPAAGRPARTGWKPPSTYRLTRLLTTDQDEDGLAEGDRLLCTRLLAEAPSLVAAVAVARRLAKLLRRASGEQKPLLEVLAAAKATPLARLAANLERDQAAVQAALELPWTTSPVEGQVNRLKTIKRSMYGRAGFQLLRQRVLQAA
jgi:transposase